MKSLKMSRVALPEELLLSLFMKVRLSNRKSWALRKGKNI